MKYFSTKNDFFAFHIQNTHKSKPACARSGTAPKRKEMQHSRLRRSLFTPQTNLKQHQTNSIQPKTLDNEIFFNQKWLFRFSHTKYTQVKTRVCTEWHSTKTKGNAALPSQTKLVHTPNQLKTTPNQFYTPKNTRYPFFSQKTIFSLFTYKIQHNAYKTKLACARSGTAPKRKEMQHSCLKRSLFTPQTNLKQHQTNSIHPKTLDIRFFLKKRFFRFSHTKYNTTHTRQNSRVQGVAQHQNERKCNTPASKGACSHPKPT